MITNLTITGTNESILIDNLGFAKRIKNIQERISEYTDPHFHLTELKQEVCQILSEENVKRFFLRTSKQERFAEVEIVDLDSFDNYVMKMKAEYLDSSTHLSEKDFLAMTELIEGKIKNLCKKNNLKFKKGKFYNNK